MKSLEEIKEISKTYSSGPIVKVALEEAIKWVEAYREVALKLWWQRADVDSEELDAEARRLLCGDTTRILEKNP